MKERPILFSAPMVRAILEGRKTQTRRAVKWPLYSDSDGGKQRIFCESAATVDEINRLMLERQRHPNMRGFCPYGQPGDRLWARETHAIVPRTAYAMSDGVQQTLRSDDNHDAAIYREGWERSTGGFRWRPSIHMPRWASRILLEIVSVRVERLQDISEDDAKAEGADPYRLPCHPEREELRHVDGFSLLWQSINGSESWDANPWVWAIEFKRVMP